MKDRVRPVGNQLAARVLARDIERIGVDLAGEACRLRGRHDVDQRELVDRLAIQAAIGNQTLGQLAPDHAGRAGDEDVHDLSPAPDTLSP